MEDEKSNGKKSFVLYSDLINIVEKIITKDRESGSNEAGELFYGILEYVNGVVPEFATFATEMAFEPIKNQLDRDFQKWEDIRKKRSEAGRKGGLISGEVRRNEANEANA